MGVLVKERVKGEWWLFISHHGKRKATPVDNLMLSILSTTDPIPGGPK